MTAATLLLVRVWLLEGLPEAEPGFQAWALDHLGLATWSPTRGGVLQRLPAKFRDYRIWRAARHLDAPGPDPQCEIIEEVTGDEVLFTPDYLPATAEEIGLAIRLLQATRADLVSVLGEAPPGALDWDPRYQGFLPWARWRSVRQVAAHLANTETHYYLGAIGFHPPWEPVPPEGEWPLFLADRRAAAIQFLDDLKGASDLARVDPDAGWSVRKVLRRMIWHERLHTKSIRRILGEYQGRHSQ